MTTTDKEKIAHKGHAAVLALAMLVATVAAHAERPMHVDDAGTLDEGTVKLELGFEKDDRVKGLAAAFGYGLVKTLEVEVAPARARDSGVSPTETINAVGTAVKWVPITAETGLSAGLKYEFGYARPREGPSESVNSLLALVSWQFEAGPLAHLNLGRDWLRSQGETEGVNVWGVGVDFPVTEAFHVTIETFGAQHSRPDSDIGLRYEIVKGLKAWGAIGRGNNRSFANLGVTWEF